MSQRWRGGFSQRNKAAPRPKKPCANPIFESWIIEWKEEAEAKDSKMKYVYAKALNSLRKYPLSLSSGKECSILENFGSHMCKMIENRMAKENMFPEESQSSASPGLLDVITLSEEEPGTSTKITATKKKPKATTTKSKTRVRNVDAEDLMCPDSEGEPQPSTSRKVTASKTKAKTMAKASGVVVVDLSCSDSEPESQQSCTKKGTAPKKRNKANPTPTEAKIPISGFAAPEFIETDTELEPKPSTSSNVKRPKGKQYLPAYRSGAYAILVALLKKEGESDYRGYMTKSELQQDAQRFCDTSLTKPDSTKHSHYTAWNSMKVLTNKELVMKRGNPVLFFLTPEGRSLAVKLLDAEKDTHVQPTSCSEKGVSDYEVSSQDEDCDVVNPSVPSTIRLEPGKFEIVLYVDTCETNGPGKSQDVINELQKNGVTIYVHRLNVGDFVWVCREVADVSGNRNRLTMSRTNELILPYVVERKRTDDLAHSIRDGRFHEQKYRLTQTKLQPIYLIESYGKGDFGLAEGALDRAITNTQIENGFLIQETSSIKDTCAYLTFMTRHLKDTYEHKIIMGCRRDDWPNLKGISTNTESYMMFFSDFNDFSVKKTNWKVKEMFARHLMRLKGLSVDKAYAIVQKHPTLDHLLKAYSKCETEKEKESLLSQVEFGTSCRKIGPSISRKVCRFYNSTNLS